MTGNDQRHGVLAERRTDGAHGMRPADLARHPSVRPHLAPWNLARFLQHRTLEGAHAAPIHANAGLSLAVQPPAKALQQPGVGLTLPFRFHAVRARVPGLEGGVVLRTPDRDHAALAERDVDVADLRRHAYVRVA